MSEALPLMDDSGPMGSANVKHLCRMGLSGAGQVTIEGNTAYLGYMYGPEGTSILDISDPRDPKLLTTIMLQNKQSHSHKVRVVGDIMVVNSEERPVTGQPYDDGGFRIYDIADKSNPKLIHFQKTFGKGVHRFDMDEDYLYLSTEAEGFIGNILEVYDIGDPAKPEKISQWWMPGQNVAAGEEPNPLGREHRLHHALRCGDQMYAGCWGSGYAIIDIADITKPKTLGTYDVHPPALEPSHTFLKIPNPIDGREIAIATDEERSNRRGDEDEPHAPLYVFDVTDPTNMLLIHTHHVSEESSPYHGTGIRFGAHQFRETIDNNVAFVTWFAAGLRILDFSRPEQPEELGYFIPVPGDRQMAPQTNDVEMDHRGLLYITDKAHGFDVIEFSG
ncbi:MAG: LVIVD repeat-containing protein [Alphaproteobacteria bacterium]